MSRSSARSKVLRVSPLVLAALLCCTSGVAQVIQQFPIAGFPWSIAVGPDGAMWFTHDGYAIGRIDSGGIVTGLPVPTNDWLDVTLGPAGDLWLTRAWGGPPRGEVVEAWIGRLTSSGALTQFRVANVGSITAGPDGNLWFTEGSRPRIGRITTSGTVTEFVLPTPSSALDITAGPDGNVWFTKPSGNRIGRITRSGSVTEFDVPFGTPYGIAAGPDGNVWFTDQYVPRIGRITPTGEITLFPSSSPAYAIVTGADGNLWAAGHRMLMRITPNGSMTDFSVPTVGDDGWMPSNPSAIAAAPDGSIWIADYSTSQIVRFTVDPTACVTESTTLCLNNGRFRVTADWRTADGSTGQGRAVALTSSSGYFWFFDADNVELVVKVLDGCSLGKAYWFFAGGLTDVEVTITVTDTQTGISRTYANPLGTPFAPIQERLTFSSCGAASGTGLSWRLFPGGGAP